MKRLSRLVLAIALLGAPACTVLSPGDPGNLVPPTVEDDPNLPSDGFNGTRFHLETFGDPKNPAIVFLHGGPGGDYRSMLTLGEQHDGQSLADRYYLIYWDQRGSGLSKRHGKDVLTIDMYLRDLDALISRYSPDRPVYLVGISWGGMYATNYINTHPDRVAGAVLIEPGPMDGATMERLKDDIIDTDLSSEWLNDFVWNSQFFTPDDHARMDYERMIGLRESQPKSHTSKENPAPGWRQGAAASRYLMEDGQDDDGKFNYDFTRNLAAFTTPVLFVTGSLSEVLGEPLQRDQVHHFPAASLVVVPGAGHDVAWVKTSEVLTHIRAYLDAREGGR